MSCSATPKLLSFYSDKVNIYDNKSFIILPTLKTCPPPPAIWYTPTTTFQHGSNAPVIIPLCPPYIYAGQGCGQIIQPCCDPCASVNGSKNCGTTTPCGGSCGGK